MTALPVTVIGGYLGSGKTTLVNHLLRHADGRRLAVLVNEFGELPIDADLIEAADDDLISIAGGCVCCSYGDDLVAALGRLRDLEPAPDHVLVEASGVALPHVIAGTVSLVRGLEREAVVVLVDAETVAARARDRYVGDTVARQLGSADLVLLNKRDLVDEAALGAARETIASRAPDARVVELERARLPAEVLLAAPRAAKEGSPGSVPEADPGPTVHPRFASVALRPEGEVDVDALVARLTSDGAGVIRAKGFLRDRGGAMRAVQVCGSRASVGPAPAGAASGLVVIGLRPGFDPTAFADLRIA